MKIIDQTPFFDENGEISLMDRVKAGMKFGGTWVAETQAQKTVIAVLEKTLDKSYILLRNVIPQGLEASIPLILVGPTGVFVLYATHLTGTFRAKGDQWGTISGSTFKPEKPNLLTRVERMARAVQVLLQRKGLLELAGVDPILLCVDPGMHVDSLRPIVRIVMRDALERFAISVSQARTSLSPEAVRDVAAYLLNQPRAPAAQPREAAPSPAAIPPEGPFPAGEGAEGDSAGQFTPAFAPFEGGEGQEAWNFDQLGLDDGGQAAASNPFVTETPVPGAAPRSRPRSRQRNALSSKQKAFLIGVFLFWCLLMAGFTFLVVNDLYPILP